MIHIHQAQLPDGTTQDFTLDDPRELTIDASHLTVLPGLIDPHVHFRTPGEEHKENWETASLAAIHGGYTTVFDMPNNKPAIITKDRLEKKIEIIEKQLQQSGVPLRYGLYFGADKNNFHQIPLIKEQVVGIKVFMGSSTGELLMDDESSLHAIFALAAAHDLLVAVHAEDECMIQNNTRLQSNTTDFTTHSKIRTPEVAEKAVRLAVSLAKHYNTRLYILHVSTINELNVIKAAKAEGVKVFAEVCPHHLFLSTNAYDTLGAKAQMNPALRTQEHQAALFDAIHAGIIDTLGSDHAPHTLEEKDQPYGKAPSGVPGIETNLPLLLNAYNEGKLSLQEIIALTHDNALTLFNLPSNDDIILVDLNKEKPVQNTTLKTKCAWSPFEGKTLTGWPVYTIVKGKCFTLD